MSATEETIEAVAVGAVIALGGVAVISIARLKHRIKTLESDIRTKEEVINVCKRNFDKAVDLLPASQLLELHRIIETDSRFHKIIIDNL